MTGFSRAPILAGLCGGVPIHIHADSLGPADRVQLKRLLGWQLAFAVAAVLIALPFGGTALLSAAIGAGVCLVANWVFALRAFARYRAQRPGAVLARMVGAEILKIGLILALFALAFATLEDLNLPALIGTYFAVQVLPALFASRPDPRPTPKT